jgi:CheY-like chemotaxis protein
VEDDHKAAELIRMQLEAEGFVVLQAASAETALVLAEQQPLSLITLDIMMMPNMDGWEFLTRLKQMPALQRIAPEDRAQLRRYMATVMEKTDFDPERFTAEVRRAVSGRKLGG